MRLPVVIAFLTLMALCTVTVHAIGVSPPEAGITFSPGMEGEFDVLILNSRPHEIGVDVVVSGDLAEYFEATGPTVTARGGAVSTVRFALPDDISPGEHVQRISYQENFFTEETGMVARTAVTLKIKVWKPYPGQYADLHVRPNHVPEGKDTDVEIEVVSRGDQPIGGDIEVVIRNEDGVVVDQDVLEDARIGADSTWRRFVHAHSSSWKPGKYPVEVRFDYGARVAETQEMLIIGTRNILINNLTDVFYKDLGVNRFELGIESMWNEPIEAVSATLQLGSTMGGTPTITLAPFSEKRLTGYWDTDVSLAEGEHNALVTLTFAGGDPVQRTFPVRVYNESLREEDPSQLITLGLTDVLFILLVLVFGGYVLTQILGRRK